MAAYPIPDWIQPADTVRQYAQGVQIGAQIAESSQRLQAQQEQAAMEAQVRMKQLEEQQAYQRQKIEMDKAYHDQLVGLRQQQLQEAAEKNDLLTKTAAQKFAAQQQYRQRIVAGEDPAKVMMELGPMMGASAGDFGAALKSTKVPSKPIWVPADKATGAPGHFETVTGAVHIPATLKPASKQALITANIRELQLRRKAITDEFSEKKLKQNPEKKKELDSINQRIDELLAGANPTPGKVVGRIQRDKDGKLKLIPGGAPADEEGLDED